MNKLKTYKHWTTVVSIIILLLAFTIYSTPKSTAQPVSTTNWTGPTNATWYGPGYYGNYFACGGTYQKNTRGVAVNQHAAKCGQRLTIKRGKRIIRVTVIDRCPSCSTSLSGPHAFDLTARSQMDLICGRNNYCRPYTIRVWWHRGW